MQASLKAFGPDGRTMGQELQEDVGSRGGAERSFWPIDSVFSLKTGPLLRGAGVQEVRGQGKGHAASPARGLKMKGGTEWRAGLRDVRNLAPGRNGPG